MEQAPSLLSLCMDATNRQLLQGVDNANEVFQLPSDILDELLTRLSPLALLKLHDEMPGSMWNDDDGADYCIKSGRKRGRIDNNFNLAWKRLYELRWSGVVEEIPDDWQQAYWELHLQNCLDEAVGKASIPSFNGKISNIKISDNILKYMGCMQYKNVSDFKYSRLGQNCLQFGRFLRSLRLRGVLCVEGCSNLLRDSSLENLSLFWIRTAKHVDELCRLLVQNRKTLTSIQFRHCSLPSNAVDAIFGSLYIEDAQSHGIQHLSVSASSFLDRKLVSLPAGLSYFLSSGRSLSSLRFCDSNLDCNFVKLLFATIFHAASNLSTLDLSENHITGGLSNFDWSKSCSVASGGNCLRSLNVLNLRGNNLCKGDINGLRYALHHMPCLRVLNISDNPIGDNQMRDLVSFFNEAADKFPSLEELYLESCEISWKGAAELLHVLSTLEKPLKCLSLADNFLGSQVAQSLGELMCSSIQVLNIEGVGLGSSGFQELQKVISKELKLIKIDISKNSGENEAAKFLSSLIVNAPTLVAANAAYNRIPARSLTLIESSLDVAKGNLERLNLTGNFSDNPPAPGSKLFEFEKNGKPVVTYSLQFSRDLHDDDP